MAIGMRDFVLDEAGMMALHPYIHGCSEPMRVEDAGRFVQVYGEPVARKPLKHFKLGG